MFANICRNVCKDSNKMFHSSFSLFLFIFFFFLPLFKRKRDTLADVSLLSEAPGLHGNFGCAARRDV